MSEDRNRLKFLCAQGTILDRIYRNAVLCVRQHPPGSYTVRVQSLYLPLVVYALKDVKLSHTLYPHLCKELLTGLNKDSMNEHR